MSEKTPKNITRSSRKGSSMSASDDEDLAEENTTPGGGAAVEQLGGLERKRDNDLTPTSETKLAGMINTSSIDLWVTALIFFQSLITS
jgi:hypothetical protein